MNKASLHLDRNLLHRLGIVAVLLVIAGALSATCVTSRSRFLCPTTPTSWPRAP